MDNEIIGGLLEVASQHFCLRLAISSTSRRMLRLTITARVEVNHVADANIDDSKEALILLLEFLLIKDLNG